MSTIHVPVYDFVHYRRKAETVTIKPRNLVIFEGIMVFVDPRVRELMDLKLYVDTPDDIRFIRGIFEQSKEQAEQGVPPNWVTYITVEDVDTVAAKVQDLGCAVIAKPFDVFDNGRMAVLQDPEGASFSLWQPNKHIGAELVNEPGTLIWNELVADDPEKLSPFYASLLNIEMKDMEGMPEYKLFTVEGNSVAGILKKTEQLQGLPSHWSIYFAVEDCDATVEKTKSLGGEIVKPAADTPMGRFAVLKDPQGAEALREPLVLLVLKTTVFFSGDKRDRDRNPYMKRGTK